MPPPQRGDKKLMSVNPPYEVGAALGGVKTITLTQAIRIAAQLLGAEAVEMAGRLEPDEWVVIAHAYQERQVEPEDDQPGPALARMVRRDHSRYRIGEPLVRRDEAAMDGLVSRLQELDYLEAWAVIIACQFRWRYGPELKNDDPWWDLAFRRQFLDANRG